MKHHLNTLFVTTDGAYLKKDGQSVVVRVNKETRLRVPLHHLDGIVTFGAIGASPALLAECGRLGISVSFLSMYGKFLARVTGFTSGNVLLRRTQYRWADIDENCLRIAKSIVCGKIANARTVLQRAARDYPDAPQQELLDRTVTRLRHTIDDVERAASAETLLGLEGDAAKAYFAVFNSMIVAQQDDFRMEGRTRRPPMDNVNALLSFLYSILAHDARSACETVGLDPAVGFFHRDRPGRPGLALDLMEEFRPFIVDRLVLSLINRRQINAKGFIRQEAGGVTMDDATRKTVLVAYQERKQDEVVHPFLNEKTSVGLLVHVQARLLARHLRGELDGYPAFIAR